MDVRRVDTVTYVKKDDKSVEVEVPFNQAIGSHKGSFKYTIKIDGEIFLKK